MRVRRKVNDSGILLARLVVALSPGLRRLALTLGVRVKGVALSAGCEAAGPEFRV